ncbi:23S rRNA (adenine(1618)-N(6))-methyltransferase RlmF [Marinobacter sp.]|uniref:23S rRNA (adenine(1618)-N(6))-methyltransferase RlmF n=1 Tax=Marinobacter sp. TaxID=50741 RepID=UPI00384AB48D
MKHDRKHRPKPPGEAGSLHPRNLHRGRYDFDALMKTSPALATALRKNPHGDLSVDFADPESVKLLNQALLRHFYQVDSWDIPPGYLCPPIPGRSDYLHYAADLLAETPGNPGNTIPRGRRIRVLDVGMGANCIYPIVGSRLYGWQFVGTDIDPVAVRSAKTIADSNPVLKGRIECRLQPSEQNIFRGVIGDREAFDLMLCNPPFHASLAEATAGTRQKVRNLAASAKKKGTRVSSEGKPQAAGGLSLNFGGQGAELWCPGGEAAFIGRMIAESAEFGEQCLWFSSLVSRSDNLPGIYRHLKKAGARDVRTMEMHQGQKITRAVAWTFLAPEQQADWCQTRWQ